MQKGSLIAIFNFMPNTVGAGVFSLFRQMELQRLHTLEKLLFLLLFDLFDYGQADLQFGVELSVAALQGIDGISRLILGL